MKRLFSPAVFMLVCCCTTVAVAQSSGPSSANSVTGAQVITPGPQYHCFQGAFQSNNRFETGTLNCAGGKSDTKTPQNVCLEMASCIFITPAIKKTLEDEAVTQKQSVTNLEKMSSDLVAKLALIIYVRDKVNLGKSSVLVCKYKGDRCETIDECQGPLLYNLTTEGSAKEATGFYQEQSDGELTPVRGKASGTEIPPPPPASGDAR